MSAGEKIFILALLIVIIVCSVILIVKIKLSNHYDENLYNEIYAEYNELFSEQNEIDIMDTEEVTADSKKNIYMEINSQGQKYRVLGKIDIPKINVNYPIIFETSDEYLKIAPAKLYGPNLNEPGNLCIVGHNYKNKEFFSKLSELKIDDVVNIQDNNGKKLSYYVYDKYEVLETDLSCTDQETNGDIELTLITCTKKKENRLVVKCRAKNQG